MTRGWFPTREESGLSIRALNAIARMNVTGWEDLARRTKRQVLLTKNCGLTTFHEISAAIHARGFAFADREQPATYEEALARIRELESELQRHRQAREEPHEQIIPAQPGFYCLERAGGETWATTIVAWRLKPSARKCLVEPIPINDRAKRDYIGERDGVVMQGGAGWAMWKSVAEWERSMDITADHIRKQRIRREEARKAQKATTT